jgi:hypothetical protein
MKLTRIACWGATAVAAGLCACDPHPKPAKPKTDGLIAASIGPHASLSAQPLDQMPVALVDQRPGLDAGSSHGAGLRPSRSASGISP